MNRVVATEVSIAPAERGHVRSMARLYAVCFPSRFVKQMGRGYLLAMFRPYVTDPSGIAIVATDPDENVVGLVTGGSRDIERRFVRSIPRRFAVQLIWGSLSNKEVRRVVVSRLSSAMRARRGETWRRSDAAFPTGAAWLYIICVHPDARGSGLADSLLEAFVDECAGRGYVRAALQTSERNSRAIRFYERNGWCVSSSDGGAVQMSREVLSASAQGGRHAPPQEAPLNTEREGQ